jgi:hypothetical protein
VNWPGITTGGNAEVINVYEGSCPHCGMNGAAILAALETIRKQGVKIMSAQDDINAADAQIEAEVADIATQDAAILAAQEQFVTTIQGLQGQGVDTSQLVADTAALLQAQGANDATVAALTAAAATAARLSPHLRRADDDRGSTRAPHRRGGHVVAVAVPDARRRYLLRHRCVH